jgi:hypothetical protein
MFTFKLDSVFSCWDKAEWKDKIELRYLFEGQRREYQSLLKIWLTWSARYSIHPASSGWQVGYCDGSEPKRK